MFTGRFILPALVLAFIVPSLQATTQSTAASMAASDLLYAMRECVESGQDPTTITMEDVGRHLDLAFMGRGHSPQGSFADSFQMLGDRGPKDPVQGQLLAVTGYQITYRWSFQRTRNAIWLREGVLHRTEEKESTLKGLFESRGMTLPYQGEWLQPNLMSDGRIINLMLLLTFPALLFAFKGVEIWSRKRERLRRGLA